ncbi:unnamed protein product [Meloidogyne enterolobii]|uniref:Uncharacterized protein n=1 Tax=Meloidogyne enterolobii TaxID=390850 RepID=A0ACB0XT84_MELEN
MKYLNFIKENILPTEECVDLETKWHMEEMAKRNATNFFPALYGMNPRELRRRVASKLTDKICVVSNKTVVESGDSGGPLLVILFEKTFWLFDYLKILFFEVIFCPRQMDTNWNTDRWPMSRKGCTNAW